MKKTILVTGVTSGIGKALAQELLLDSNVELFGIGRDDSKIQDLLIGHKNFNFINFDLAQIDRIEELFKKNFKDVKFSGFVHCAGIEETIPISLYTPEKILQIFQINVFSAIELLRFISKKKHSEDAASFILVSSVMGELGQAGKVGYCSSKAALLGVVKSLALELSKRLIRVNAVLPGIVNTPLTQKLFDQLDESNVERIKLMHPVGIGSPSDVVGILMYLLSKKSIWMTGQNIKIDGGYSTQ
ncbi:SDR family NAD(P)-dependent oxidoreductase [Sphingobacterium sp. 1.A.4]|uniref:SDR family NAD(P)-dependent oxidoreductase n=1 Tax=Sphingobacterium sp. 1.A.4 TaxID=2044603 RepID=UPI0015D4FA23|nr:SDR family oxidoreductase [Sphingobacterium sp. 1.A.4]